MTTSGANQSQDEIERIFEDQATNLSTEVTHASNCFNILLSIRTLLTDDPDTKRVVSLTPLFWSTTLSATQTSLVMTLTRIFEHKSNYSINSIMKMIAEHGEILFSADAINARRFKAVPSEQRSKIFRYPIIPVRSSPSPTLAKEIAKQLKKHRDHYDKQLMVLRDKWFAHRELNEEDIYGYLVNAMHPEPIQDMLDFLLVFHQQLFQLYWNGMIPDIKLLKKPPRQSSLMSGEVRRLLLGK
jgi:hypothetical protein